MKLTPREIDHLRLHNAGFLAQKRLARGVRLNLPEAVALLATQTLEFIRDGKKSVAELMDLGRQLLGTRQVLPGVAEELDEVQVEGTFEDGTKLVTIHHPVSRTDGDLALALYGSFLPVPPLTAFADDAESGAASVSAGQEAGEMVLGQVTALPGDLVINGGRETISLSVANLADRPIQVGSHYHFIETNPFLKFDRAAAYGKRLNILAGTAVRFEPGDVKTVSLVEIAGHKIIRGGNGICDGPVAPAHLPAVMARLTEQGFAHQEQGPPPSKRQKPNSIAREVYAKMYGPTTGDLVRLGDTELIIRVEKDCCVYVSPSWGNACHSPLAFSFSIAHAFASRSHTHAARTSQVW